MKEELNFYDVKSKKKFITNDYMIVKKGNRYFAVTPSRTGAHNCYRIISKVHAQKYVKVAEE